MISAHDLHNNHKELVSEILFLKDELHFIKNVVYGRSMATANEFQKEKLEDLLEESGQIISSLDELEIDSKSVEHRVKALLESKTVKMDDSIFQEVKGFIENLTAQKDRVKSLKKTLFKLD